MSEKILDLHIHSRYSRACSSDLELPKIAKACEQKGIDIIVTGDFTYPAWIKHIKENLVEDRKGIYKLKDNSSQTRFILGTEISCIYKHKDATRRVHLLILAPSIEAVEKFNAILTEKGVNIRSDGRPIMGLSAKAVLQIILDIDPRFMMIPAHIWTPWFAVFGSKSGYNALEECFEELTPHIRAAETGLSSDPTMNHRLSRLDNITLISNSDAHSLNNLGREANVFNLEENFTYEDILQILKTGDRKKFLYTIEFYPEEGKYHYDGHAVCGVCLTPQETKAKKFLCPKCKKPVTVGVLHRVEDLADRPEEKINQNNFIPHKYIVPLKEILAKVFGMGVASKKVVKEYEEMLKKIGSEFFILLKADIKEIEKNVSDKNIALAIANMRQGNVKVKPGYDGIFGSVEVIQPKQKPGEKQSRLF
ncbi:MAG: DNA and RNA helicase [Parcubacteria group bacterium Gr01-1014_13]|nr:MAG: DNA and RNA helicase [Parcubacteria group bacterium Gr01-1014_13]